MNDGWAWEKGNFSIKKFKSWLRKNKIDDTEWKFRVTSDGVLIVCFCVEEDASAFKLKFIDHEQISYRF